MPSTHFRSAHFASIHFLSNHFSGGDLGQVVTVPFDDVGGWDEMDQVLRRVPNGDIVVIAAAALMICHDDLE